MKLFRTLKLIGLATILSASTSAAQTFGAAADYSLFVTTDGKLDAKEFAIDGNVAISSGADAKAQDITPFTGRVDVYGNTSNFENKNNSATPSYGINSSSAINTSLKQANADLVSLVSYYNGLTANSSGSGDSNSGTGVSHDGNLTLNSTQAVNVFDFKKVEFDNDTITLNSRAGYDDLFVIRINKGLDTKKTLMSAGVNPNQVIWLINDGDAKANHGSPLSGGYSFEGTIINLDGKVTLGGEGQFNGKVYANEIKLGSEGSFKSATPGPIQVPEPSSTALLGLGTIALLVRRKR